jgi:large subunit ribosomal protein L35
VGFFRLIVPAWGANKNGFFPDAMGSSLKDSIMTKQKTHKSTKKRFRLTATGKVKHRKCGTSHLAIAKPAKKIRQLRGTRVLEPNLTRAIVDALRGNSY